MKTRMMTIVLLSFVALACVGRSQAQKIKVIVDQDARGPATTDMQSILIFLQSDKFDVLGITTVTGDQWVKEETRRTLRLLEIAGRTDVPVIQGAEFPLLNSKRRPSIGSSFTENSATKAVGVIFRSGLTACRPRSARAITTLM